MRDQEIYAEVAQIIYREIGNKKSELHLLAFVANNAVDSALWHGPKKNKDTGLRLSGLATTRVSELLKELQSFYKENNMGVWNVIMFTLNLANGQYDFEFEFSEELKDGRVPFWEFSRKYG